MRKEVVEKRTNQWTDFPNNIQQQHQQLYTDPKLLQQMRGDVQRIKKQSNFGIL